jgi:hypothetical protein
MLPTVVIQAMLNDPTDNTGRGETGDTVLIGRDLVRSIRARGPRHRGDVTSGLRYEVLA